MEFLGHCTKKISRRTRKSVSPENSPSFRAERISGAGTRKNKCELRLIFAAIVDRYPEIF